MEPAVMDTVKHMSENFWNNKKVLNMQLKHNDFT